MTHTTDLQWYGLYTRPRHEKAVADQLGQRDIDHFLPLREVVSQWKDRKKRVHLPLFPGYLFVHIPVNERRLDVLRLPSAVHFVEFNSTPAPIPVEQIEAVQRLVYSTLPFDPYPDMVQGDRVEVQRGPLRGLQGTLVRKKSTARFVLSVDLIQQAVSCEIDACDVVKISPQWVAARSA